MKFISICSGIEAASVAFNTIGWKAVAFSEIEPFPCALLAHRYPDIPNFGDMTKFKEWPEEVFAEADMIVGGPPCQSFSVAGKRNGLNDERGNLTLIYTELTDHADAIRLKYGKPPCIILYENVPGILSDKTGAFGCLLGELAGETCELQPPGRASKWANAGCVFGPQRTVAWRVLDAQYFGVAQRRRRVFVVASARTGFDPAEILFEFDGLRRDTAPSRKARQEASSAVGSGIEGGSRPALGQNGFRMTAFGEYADDETASTMKARDYKDATDLVSYGIPGNWIGRKPENGGNSTQFMHEIAPAQTATDKHGIIAFNSRQDPVSGDVFGSLDTSSPQAQAAATATAVRRLTPVECERLQGFKDGYTAIPWRGKPADQCPDGHRYKALGNSWAVPVVRWIGSRIDAAVNLHTSGNNSKLSPTYVEGL